MSFTLVRSYSLRVLTATVAAAILSMSAFGAMDKKTLEEDLWKD